MSYTLYIAENCHQCALVLDYIKARQPEVKVINVDTGSGKPPVDTFVYPALYRQEKLIAYGEDIIRFFNQ